MRLQQDCVKHFHEVFALSQQREFSAPPERVLQILAEVSEAMEQASRELVEFFEEDDSAIALRSHLMLEELFEFFEGVKENNEIVAFDAVIDLLYVTLGTCETYDWPAEAGFAEVHASNMSKAKASDGTPENEHRLRDKGEDYVPPALDLVLERWRSNSLRNNLTGMNLIRRAFQDAIDRRTGQRGQVDTGPESAEA